MSLNVFPRLATVSLLIATFGSGGCSPPVQALIQLPDGSQAYSFRENSAPFGVSRGVTEEEVIAQRAPEFCPRGYTIVSKHRAFPENYSLVIVDAIIKCKG